MFITLLFVNTAHHLNDVPGMKKEFSHREFADYIRDGIIKTFDAIKGKQ